MDAWEPSSKLILPEDVPTGLSWLCVNPSVAADDRQVLRTGSTYRQTGSTFRGSPAWISGLVPRKVGPLSPRYLPLSSYCHVISLSIVTRRL